MDTIKENVPGDTVNNLVVEVVETYPYVGVVLLTDILTKLVHLKLWPEQQGVLGAVVVDYLEKTRRHRGELAEITNSIDGSTSERHLVFVLGCHAT